ncbi:MAG: FAD-binding protein [Lachnospiraceae bacterium]|jgi:succinate dehydrogenase/fumarate reductase flavoprotein subunit|nr:FAD-binding protein [Lachnospiraceae bacterium]
MKREGISRRDFLRGTMASALGVAATGILGACSPAGAATDPATTSASVNEETTKAETTAAETTAAETAPQMESGQTAPVLESTPYEVYHTELLVIGTGNAGVWATQRAMEEGKTILMVDKGPFRHSGASAMSWDALMIWHDYAGMRTPDWQLINGETAQAAFDYLGGAEFNPYVESINHGQTLPFRDANGEVAPISPQLPKTTVSAFFRREMDALLGTGRINVMDQTMITDLLVNGDRCLGAIGIYLPTGRMRVIRADATIMASSGCTQIHGWLNIGYRGINSTDNTGDVPMAAFRHGLKIGESEFAQYDFNSIIFKDVAHTFGCGIGADAGELEVLFDANHERIFADDEVVNGNLGMCQRIGELVFKDKKGTANDGVYCTYTQESYETVRYPIMRNVRFFQEHGFDPIGNYFEVAAEMYEHGGAPIIDKNMMTELKGLFDVRGAGACGENGGPHMCHNRLYGHYTGKCAVNYLNAAPAVGEEEIDWTPVEEECRRLSEIRTRKVENGLRPHEIRRKIQAAGYRGFTIYRTTEMMEEAIAELERIRREDMPRQVLADDSTTFNVEWKSAIENINMLDSAEMSIRASLLREETRGCYFRPEFPQKDDVNWNCMLACHLEGDEMVFEKIPYPEIGG